MSKFKQKLNQFIELKNLKENKMTVQYILTDGKGNVLKNNSITYTPNSLSLSPFSLSSDSNGVIDITGFPSGAIWSPETDKIVITGVITTE